MKLSKKMYTLRKERGFSLDKLADLTGSSKSYIWELENPLQRKKAVKPSGEKLAKIAKALSVTTDYLLDESAQPNEQVTKEAFFRKFSQLSPDDKKRIEEMIELWSSCRISRKKEQRDMARSFVCSAGDFYPYE